MRKFYCFLGILLFQYSVSIAQDRVVTGTVTESNGTPVTSASIVIKGSNRGTATGIDGTFRISVPYAAKTLVISGVNLQPLEINISSKTNLGVITLQPANKSLDEVVVVAYGAAKKSTLTGSVTTVSGAQLADKPFSSLDKTLQGSVAGLQVASTSGAPGSSTAIRIRGIGSIAAGASPLWVIDGVIANTTDVSVNTTTANPLSALNPDDIESISVLKDASSTAIYGSLAANGVILVTTKKGKAGKTHLNVVSEIGQNSDAFHPSNKPTNTQQAQTLLRQAVINANEATDIPSADAFLTGPNFGLPADYASHYTNWHDAVTRKGNQSQLNVNLSGGNEKTQFYASAGFFNQDGTTIATSFKRYNGTLSINHKASDRFNFSTTLSGSTATQHTPTNGGFFSNPVGAYYFLPAWYTPYNQDGSLKYNDPQGEFPLGGGSGWNPLVTSAWDKNTLVQTSFKGNVTGEAKILDNLKFTSRYAAEYFDISEDQYQNPFYGDGFANGGTATSDYSRVFDYTWSNFFDFKQGLNADKDFYFDLKAGYEARQYNLYTLQAAGNVFPQTRQLQWLASASTPTTAYALPSGNATNSIFALGDINYKDKYVLSASFRRDGSSVFGADKRYGSFYSVGGSWNINEESFLKNSDKISMLKLRASYGETGNAIGFGNYTALPYYSYGTSSNYSYNYMGQPGGALSNAGYPNLTWEKNKIFNLALDYGFFKDRLTGTIEYYTRTTSDLLLSVPYSYTSGLINPVTTAPTQNENVGSMQNKGIEFTITGKPVVTRDFSWTVSFNIAHNANKVTALYQGKPIPSPNGLFNYTVGHDLLTYYLRQWGGANPIDGTPLWYTDATHKATTGSYSSAGLALNYSASPKVFGSFTNSFNYKGITLDAQFYYNFGNYVYDSWGIYTSSDGLYNSNTNQLSKELRAWQKPGDKTDVPQIIDGGNKNSYRTSTRYLYKGDYIRLRNLQLGYNLPASLVQKAHIGSVSIYVRGTNLLTFGVTKDIPFDPESGIFSSGGANAGNLDVYIPKTITGGIKIGF
jgi:TonB-linked SusC/RagA family outer membrane protein